jgi:transposase
VCCGDGQLCHSPQGHHQLTCSGKRAIAVFLPPYSPSFNPIEQVFGKLKQL